MGQLALEPEHASATSHVLIAGRHVVERDDPSVLGRDGRDLVADPGVKVGKLMQPLRAVIAGTTESPGMFEMLGALGRERVLARLDRVIQG